MAKTTKKVSKAKVGSSKSKNKKSNLTPRNALFTLVGVMVFSIAAGMAWMQWQDHQMEAQAENWPNISDSANIIARACKTQTGRNTYTVKIKVTSKIPFFDTVGASVHGPILEIGQADGYKSFRGRSHTFKFTVNNGGALLQGIGFNWAEVNSGQDNGWRSVPAHGKNISSINTRC